MKIDLALGADPLSPRPPRRVRIGDVVDFNKMELPDACAEDSLEERMPYLVTRAAIVTGVGVKVQGGDLPELPIVFLTVFTVDGAWETCAEHAAEPQPDCWSWREETDRAGEGTFTYG